MAMVANAALILLSLLMGFRLLGQYRQRARTHTLWYAVGLMLTAVAAIPEIYLQIAGGLITPLWWLYWVAASSLVGFLAVGTAYLLGPGVGKVTLWSVIALTAILLIATVATAGAVPAKVDLTITPTVYIKVPFVLQSALGAVLIFVGAVISWLRNRALYNVWIALGTVVFAAGGSAAGIGVPGMFYFTQMAGILLLYVGVSQSTAPRQQPTNAAVRAG